MFEVGILLTKERKFYPNVLSILQGDLNVILGAKENKGVIERPSPILAVFVVHIP
jgi:hypothetical protein